MYGSCCGSYLSNPRLRALADKYFHSGDLAGLLTAINNDYEAMGAKNETEDPMSAAAVLRRVRALVAH